MFVIIAKSGLIIFVKLSISPFLSIPTSKTPNSSLNFKLNKLNGTPYLLLKDLGEKVVLDIFFNVSPIISFKVVFPQLPVIDIIFAFVLFLKIDEHLVKKLRVLFTLICFDDELFLFILFTIAKLDFFLNASETNLFPLIFFLLLQKKRHFFFLFLYLFKYF